jgi:ATP-dependent DNA helicase DinG
MRVREFFKTGGPLHRAVGSGYVYREGQVEFAERAYRCFARSGGSVLLADQKTGTGKSLAYLVAATLAGVPVVVSTNTKVLQEQLRRKDVPILQAACKEAGLEVPTAAVQKGRGNFLCPRRFHEFLEEPTVNASSDVLDRVKAWRHDTSDGDITAAPFSQPDFWDDVRADSDDCHRRSCPYSEECFYFQQKDRAAGVDILIVNHALLMQNVASGGALFRLKDRHLVLDEGHHTEARISESYGASVTRHRVLYVARSIRRKLYGEEGLYEDVKAAAGAFFKELGSCQTLHDFDAAPPSLRSLLTSLTTLHDRAEKNPAEEVNKLSGMTQSLLEDLVLFYSPPEPQYAYEVEKRGKGYALKAHLVDTDRVFRGAILRRAGDEGPATVLTSATLAAGPSFDYLEWRLGIDAYPGTVDELVGEEMFDYRSNSLIYIPSDLPSPSYASAGEHTEAGMLRAADLVKLSSGRALILLATHKALRRYKEAFDELIPHPVKFQGSRESNNRLVEWLRETSDGVVVGTRSFWEGVDIAGPALSLVVVDKTPFPNMRDPVLVKLAERASNEFVEVALPRAVTALRQGVGRLIRHHDDTGCIAILDPRLLSSAWGRRVLRAMPKGAPISSDIADVARFFDRAGGEAAYLTLR